MSSKNNCATTHGTNSDLMRFLPEMLDDLPYLVAQVGPDGRYLYVNRAYAQWFGLRAEDMLGRLQSEHMGPKLGFRVGEGLRAAFLGNAVEIDHEVRGADGSNRIMQANYLPHFDSGKPASRVTVMLRDVTEKRRQLVCFGQTQRNFQLLVENCKDVIFRLRLIDGVYEYVSPASLEVTGYPPETYYNEPLHIKNFIHPDWRDRLELRWRLLQDGSDVPESFEFQIVHPLKGDRWISQRNSLVRDGQGQPVVLEGAATDVTEMKLKEEELARAKALAESASKAKSEFLARVSHETRTPLHGILGQAGLALEQTKDPVLGRRLKAIRDSASHLHAMVSDILDFSDLETGHVQSGPDDAPFSLSELVWRVGDMFKTQAAEKGLEFKVVIQPGTPVNVVGDGRRLRQILVHLLSNAIKFTESGETLLTLESAPPQGASASLDQKSTAPIRFTVSDTGPGMTPKVLDSILNGFQQGRGDLGGRPQGLGLGLSLARRMVELLGGVLHVESRPGQGSDFSFTLPLSKNPNAEGASSPEEQRNEPLRILLAEDNPLSASLMSEWLVRAGHQPFLARNGREALEKLKTESCDVALMDLEMPLMSGLEAANRVRAGECGEAVRSMPIYAITAHVLPEYKEMCEHIGITGFFSKPLDMNTLLSVLGVVDRTDAEASNSDPTGDETADEGLPDKSAQIREFGGNDAFVKKLYALFRNQSSKEIKIIRESLFKGDVEAALRGSHSMKNSALGVGAHRLAKLAEDFQKSNVRDLSGAAHHLEALEAELTRVLNWIG